jgi:threonylcarbamoyladenosine tRNA methylthiotransferase MtaB
MKIFLETIGCRVNTAEIESMARQFRAAGHVIVPTAAEADLAVVNTCTVTTEAASDSRSTIRRVKKQGAGRVIVTGCWASLEPQQAVGLPGVYQVIPNLEKHRLVNNVLDLPDGLYDLEPLARQPLPGIHHRTRAFIKIQDGCDNACSYCITRLARGASRSMVKGEISLDIRSALQGGCQEIVLTGVHLGSWGLDLRPPQRLHDLVASLLSGLPIPRLRLSSMEPWDLDADFLNLWQDARMCRHLHLPLQSGSATVLKRMRRNTTPEKFIQLVDAARQVIPEVAITTDIIAGFPGETEVEFQSTLECIQQVDFAGGHVFHFSPRPGTAAAEMSPIVPGAIARHRSSLLREALVQSAKTFNTRFIGMTMPVLWESTTSLADAGWLHEGLTDNYIRVKATLPEPRWNQVDRVLLLSADEHGCSGEIKE